MSDTYGTAKQRKKYVKEKSVRHKVSAKKKKRIIQSHISEPKAEDGKRAVIRMRLRSY